MMMKKYFSMVLAFLLILMSFACFAQESAEALDSYDRAGLELVREYEVRHKIAAMEECEKGDKREEFSFFGLSIDYSIFPTGIILDKDDNCVVLTGTNTAMTLVLREGETDAGEIAAGYALFQAFSSSSDDNEPIDCYILENNEFQQLEFKQALSEWAVPYVLLADSAEMLRWVPNRKYENLMDESIARIHALRTYGCVYDGSLVENELEYEGFEDSVLIFEDNNQFILQSASRSYVFSYPESCRDQALKHMVFTLFVAGNELYEMDIYYVTDDGSGGYRADLAPYEDIKEFFSSFRESYYLLFD